jgi:hypothetical protein
MDIGGAKAFCNARTAAAGWLQLPCHDTLRIQREASSSCPAMAHRTSVDDKRGPAACCFDAPAAAAYVGTCQLLTPVLPVLLPSPLSTRYLLRSLSVCVSWTLRSLRRTMVLARTTHALARVTWLSSRHSAPQSRRCSCSRTRGSRWWTQHAHGWQR